MATVTGGAVVPLDFRLLDVAALLTGTETVHTSTNLTVDYGGGDQDVFTGFGVTYDGSGQPISGTITGYSSFSGGSLAAQVTGLSASATQFMGFVVKGDTLGGLGLMLNGDDQVTGTGFADYVAGFAGNDTLQGLGGNDTLVGGSGNDVLDGGNGVDAAAYANTVGAYRLAVINGFWTVLDQRAGSPDGFDRLFGVEHLLFGAQSVDLTISDVATNAAISRIMRTTQTYDVSTLVANGLTTEAAAMPAVLITARATTSVATLAYEFFTGKTPSAAGMDYLVSPTGPNPSNLNAAYYQSFGLENRYINFAVNLGKVGEGNASFTARYGALSLFEATRAAYATIFGEAPSDTKLHALLDPTTVLNGQTFTRADYFAYYGQDGASGIGTKAAMVGWLLAEAVKADVGTYALSNDAFLTDVGLHNAAFGVDLVGHYSQPGFVFHPG